MMVEEQKVKQWYVVHAYSGYENFVLREINTRARHHHFESKIGEVVVPSEEVVEILFTLQIEVILLVSIII